MTDTRHDMVPIKSYVDAVTSGLRWWIVTGAVTAAIGFAALIHTIDKKNDAAVKLALGGMEKATEVAFDAAEAKGVQHNGLIEYLRQLMGRFVTWQSAMGFLTAVGVMGAIYVAFVK